ncbi:hypothetical protein HDU92_004676 [Lobulomyces angularis]|nr:hypothetical protein HDU92_004676 [Lobulomyces angularis]
MNLTRLLTNAASTENNSCININSSYLDGNDNSSMTSKSSSINTSINNCVETTSSNKSVINSLDTTFISNKSSFKATSSVFNSSFSSINFQSTEFATDEVQSKRSNHTSNRDTDSSSSSIDNSPKQSFDYLPLSDSQNSSPFQNELPFTWSSSDVFSTKSSSIKPSLVSTSFNLPVPNVTKSSFINICKPTLEQKNENDIQLRNFSKSSNLQTSTKTFYKKSKNDTVSKNFLECAAGCGRKFKSRSHLIRHERMHSGEKPFKCTKAGCNKSFSRRDNMTQHYVTHSTEKKIN